ncbi:hypothetical protein ACTXT7_008373 [Hymenolepis weldensis]
MYLRTFFLIFAIPTAANMKKRLEVYWLKNGKRVDRQTFPHIVIDDYNRLIVDQVELQDEGNYTCVADTLGIEQRYSTAEVTVLPFRRDSQTRLSMTPWSIWSSCRLDPVTGRCQQIRMRSCVNMTIGEINSSPSVSKFDEGPIDCPQPVSEIRICDSLECHGEILGDPKGSSLALNVREIMFYVGLTAAFTITVIIILTVCRLNRKKPSSFNNPLCPRQFSSRQMDYGKSMTVLKNSQHSTYDLPPLSNGVGTPKGSDTSMGLIDYPMNGKVSNLPIQSQFQRSVAGTETYNQPYSSESQRFNPMTPIFTNGSAFQSPKFNYLPKDSSVMQFSPLTVGGYANAPPQTPLIPPAPPLHMLPSRSSGSSSAGGLQTSNQQQQPIYLSPSSTSNNGIPCGEGGDENSSAFYHEIGTSADSIFPLIPPLPVSAGETGSATWANIGSVGGVVHLPESGINLRIPPGAIPAGVSREVYLAACRDEKYWPTLNEHQTLLSSVVQVGLPGAPLSKPVIITFPHCANMTGQGIWSFSIHCYCSSGFDSLYKDAESNTIEWSWKEVSRVGQEQARDPIHCHLSGNQVHLMTQYPLRFCLIGQAATLAPTNPATLLVGPARMGMSTDCSENHSGSSMATETTNDTFTLPPLAPPLSKRLRLIACAGRLTMATDCSLRIYAVLDTPDAVRHVKDTEAKLDGQLIGGGKQMLFRNNAGGLVFRIQELATHWRARLSCQAESMNIIRSSITTISENSSFELMPDIEEIPFRHIWSGNRNTLLHCAFTLERVDDVASGLHCTIACQQDGVQGTQQLLHLNINNGSPEGQHLITSQIGNSSFCEQNDFRLQSYVVSQLCSMLDPIVPLGNDWRQLAQNLNMERFLPYFASTQRPTEMILNLWEAATNTKGSLANQELVSVLQTMHRLDCANLIRSQTSGSRGDHV